MRLAILPVAMKENTAFANVTMHLSLIPGNSFVLQFVDPNCVFIAFSLSDCVPCLYYFFRMLFVFRPLKYLFYHSPFINQKGGAVQPHILAAI